MDKITYALCKKYVEETAIALGAVKGAPCTIDSTSVSPDGKTITVVFGWMSNTTPPVKQTTSITITNGTISEVTPILTSGTKIATITVDGVPKDIYAPEGGSDAELQNNLTTSITVGGVPSGKAYPKGTPLEDIFNDMLNPTLNPTFTNPSASLSATGAKLLEKGSTLAVTFTATFNRGSISPAYGTSGYRSGNANGYKLNGGATQVNNTWNVTVSEAQTSYQANVSYVAGEQPKNSKGGNYDSPLPAGSVNTNTIAYEFVDAIWANTSNIATIAKLALVSLSAKQKDMVFPAQTVSNPEVFDVPASWTVTAVQVKNDLSGAYEDASDQFTVTNVTHNDAAGNTVNYKRYTFNLGYDTGARTVRLKWA